MGSVSTHFEPSLGGRIRFRSRIEDVTGRVGYNDITISYQRDVFGIPWADFVAAGYGSIEEFEDRPPAIRRVDDQLGDTETDAGVQTLRQEREPRCPPPVPSWPPRSPTWSGG